MLVLTRFPSERIFIGNDIIITLIEVDRNRVRLGIEAPRGVEILREEVRARVIAKNLEKTTQPPLQPDQ